MSREQWARRLDELRTIQDVHDATDAMLLELAQAVTALQDVPMISKENVASAFENLTNARTRYRLDHLSMHIMHAQAAIEELDASEAEGEPK